jgi:hypothetical protein
MIGTRRRSGQIDSVHHTWKGCQPDIISYQRHAPACLFLYMFQTIIFSLSARFG